MEYLVGIILALSVAAFATWIGFDRERSFYPTVVIVIAAYYPLFATMGASGTTITVEVLIALAFSTVGVVGYKRSPWLVAAAIAGHGVFDLLFHGVIDNPGMPVWWPGFCGTVDLLLGAWLALLLLARSPQPRLKAIRAMIGFTRMEPTL
jgi:hypothetical protein